MASRLQFVKGIKVTDIGIPAILEEASSLIRQVGWSKSEYVERESLEQNRERVGVARHYREGPEVIAYSLPAAIRSTFQLPAFLVEEEMRDTALAMAHAVTYEKFGDNINVSLNLKTKAHGLMKYVGMAEFRKFLETKEASSWIETFTYPLDDFERILRSGVIEELMRANRISQDEHDVFEIISVAREKARRSSFNPRLKWYSHLPRAGQ